MAKTLLKDLPEMKSKNTLEFHDGSVDEYWCNKGSMFLSGLLAECQIKAKPKTEKKIVPELALVPARV